MDIRVSIVTTERSPSSDACPDLSVPSTFYSLRVLRAGTGLGTAFDDADTGGQSGMEVCSAGQTSAWLSTVTFVLGVLLALAWKSGLVPDRQVWSDCPCRQQIPESQVGTNESGPPRGPRGIPIRMWGGDRPRFWGLEWGNKAEGPGQVLYGLEMSKPQLLDLPFPHCPLTPGLLHPSYRTAK